MYDGKCKTDDGMDSAVICEISGKLLEFVPADLRRLAQR